MIDMKLEPKSDQLNADDLITGPITVTIVGVRQGNTEQPVEFQLKDRKPYYPCKSMRRLIVSAWGNVAADYIGRRMTLFRDPSVSFGGMVVGGIRISHMSHLEAPMVVALTVTRAKRAPYRVMPLTAVVDARSRLGELHGQLLELEREWTAYQEGTALSDDYEQALTACVSELRALPDGLRALAGSERDDARALYQRADAAAKKLQAALAADKAATHE